MFLHTNFIPQAANTRNLTNRVCSCFREITISIHSFFSIIDLLTCFSLHICYLSMRWRVFTHKHNHIDTSLHRRKAKSSLSHMDRRSYYGEPL